MAGFPKHLLFVWYASFIPISHQALRTNRQPPVKDQTSRPQCHRQLENQNTNRAALRLCEPPHHGTVWRREFDRSAVDHDTSSRIDDEPCHNLCGDVLVCTGSGCWGGGNKWEGFAGGNGSICCGTGGVHWDQFVRRVRKFDGFMNIGTLFWVKVVSVVDILCR